MLLLAATLIRQTLTASASYQSTRNHIDMMEQIKVMLVNWMDRDIQDRCFMLVLADIAKFFPRFPAEIANNP